MEKEIKKPKLNPCKNCGTPMVCLGYRENKEGELECYNWICPNPYCPSNGGHPNDNFKPQMDYANPKLR